MKLSLFWVNDIKSLLDQFSVWMLFIKLVLFKLVVAIWLYTPWDFVYLNQLNLILCHGVWLVFRYDLSSPGVTGLIIIRLTCWCGIIKLWSCHMWVELCGTLHSLLQSPVCCGKHPFLWRAFLISFSFSDGKIRCLLHNFMSVGVQLLFWAQSLEGSLWLVKAM